MKMIDAARAVEIRAAFVECGRNFSRTARACGCTRATVKKILARDYDQNGGRTRRSHTFPWDHAIRELLEANAADAAARRKNRIKGARIIELLRARGCVLSARQLYRRIACVRDAVGESQASPAFLKLRGIAGHGQVDFGEMDVTIGGHRRRVHLLVLALPYSNAAACVVCQAENTPCLCAGLEKCFEMLGGTPPVLRFDNLAAVVTRMIKGSRCERVLNDGFSRWAAHHGITVELCNPAAGWEKGCVEKKVGYVRDHFFIPIPRFETIDALNAALATWCELDRRRPHYAKADTIEALFHTDISAFMPTCAPYPLERLNVYRCDKYGFVAFEKNRYFAGPKCGLKHVVVRATSDGIEICDLNFNALQKYPRCYDTGKIVQNGDDLACMLALKPKAIPYVLNGTPQDLREFKAYMARLPFRERIPQILAKLPDSPSMVHSLAGLMRVIEADPHAYDGLCKRYEKRKKL